MCVGGEAESRREEEGGRGMETEWEGKRAPGRCFAEVSAVDKVFMTLGQFSADIQELHATRPLMKVSWPNSTVCHCGLVGATPQSAHHIIIATARASDWDKYYHPGFLINSNFTCLDILHVHAWCKAKSQTRKLVRNHEKSQGKGFLIMIIHVTPCLHRRCFDSQFFSCAELMVFYFNQSNCWHIPCQTNGRLCASSKRLQFLYINIVQHMFDLFLCSFGVHKYVSYLIINAFWKEAEKQVVGLPMTNETVINSWCCSSLTQDKFKTLSHTRGMAGADVQGGKGKQLYFFTFKKLKK